MHRTASAPPSVWRPLCLDDFLIGAPHYPEQIEESRWKRDAERMAAAGFNVIRMGEFAWHIFEPSEGRFDFDLFDKAIDVLGQAGVKTILCTPTATPPRWLTANYPEVLRVDANGRPASHGSRQHPDTASPVYRAHSRRIATAMAKHYWQNPNVIGWQTDNELNTTVSEFLFGGDADRLPHFPCRQIRDHRRSEPRLGRRHLGDRLRSFRPGRPAAALGARLRRPGTPSGLPSLPCRGDCRLPA